MLARPHTRACAIFVFIFVFIFVGGLVGGAIGCREAGIVLTLGAAGSPPPSYCVSLGAGGVRRYGARFPSSSDPLPQTVGVRADGQKAATAFLDGIGAAGLPVEHDFLGVTFGTNVVQAGLTLAACKPRASGAITQVAQVAQVADRLAIVRSGAEVAGGAELVAIGGTTGARYRYDGKTLAAQSGATLAHGAGSSVTMLSVLDVDGDCADDLVVATGTQPTAVWPSATDGDLQPDASRIAVKFDGRAQALGDVVGEDGWADLVMVGDDGGAVLASDHAHGFVAGASGFDTAPSNATAVALADFDDDGRLDAVVGFQSGPLRWYSGDGKGDFSLQPALPGSFTTNQLVALDLDGDKRVDIVAATADGGLRVFLNQGSGSFADQSATAVPGTLDTDAISVLVTDLDADCVDDLVVVQGTQAPVWLDWSQGALTQRQSIDTNAASAAAAGDLDGDGVPDLALIENGMIVVFSTLGGAS